MAQHYYGLPGNAISLFSAPDTSVTYPAATSYSAVSLAPSGTANVKVEPPAFSQGHDTVKFLHSTRPNKRQKVVDEDSGHKFVSQKKWKFSDSQTWIPSKVSSKAHNASKIAVRSKQESASPERLVSLMVTPSNSSLTASSNSTQLSHYEGLGQDQFPPQSVPVEVVSQPPYASTSKTVRGHSTASAQRPLNPQHSSKLSQSEEAPGPGPGPGSVRVSGIGKNMSLDLPAAVSPAMESRGATEKARSRKSARALSLEKDAERIAALIAEKRKKNESNMFRQRLLQQQQKHNTLRESSRMQEGSLELLSPNTTTNSPEIRNSQHRACERPSTGMLSSSSSPGSVRLSRSPGIASQTSIPTQTSKRPTPRLDTKSRSQDQAPLKEQGMLGSINTVLSAAPESKQPVGQSERQALLNPRAMPQGTTIAHRIETPVASGPNSQAVKVAQDSVSLSATGVDLSRTVNSATNQDTRTLTKAERLNQDAHLQNHRGQRRVSSSQNQIPVPQRIPSRSPVESSPMPTGSYSFQLSASPSYAQSPPNMTIHHFSNLGISSPSPHRTIATRPSNATHYGQQQPRQALSVNLASLVDPNGQPWGSRSLYGNRAGTTNHVKPPGLSSGRHVVNHTMTSSNASFNQTQQRTPPNSMSISGSTNVGAFHNSGHPGSRSNVNADNVDSVAPVSSSNKPSARTNMFSNPKGTPFPMEEVIRQIEMT